MPWSNQGGGGGGGPWGSPPGGGGNGPSPWGRPPGSGGGGPQTPDLEELLRQGQEKLRKMLPGGFGGNKSIQLVGVALLALWLASGFYRVQADETGVVLRFGELVRKENPGLRYHWPAPIEAVFTPRVTRVNRIEIGYRSTTNSVETRRGTSNDRDVPDESLMLTGDENIIDIDFTVFWLIKDAGNYLFRVRDPEATVKKAAESAMREVIGRTELQPALTEARQQIETGTLSLLQNMLDEYQTGIQVTQVQLQKADPPAPVVDAFNDVQRARSDRERLRNEAEAYRNDIIPRARGDAERLNQESQAYREQVVNLAQGDASRFSAIYTAYIQAKDVISRRMYLETMEQVMRGTNKVIVEPGAAGQGVLPYLQLPQLNRAPAPTAAPTVSQQQRR
ncbi:MAG: FtsH protease activity modulator HflK [Rhodospirillaceae bacterium]